MRHFFLFFMLCMSFLTNVTAQTPICVPDPLFKDSLVGVFPSPKSTTNPKGGITKAACIGAPYSFTFTVKLADKVTVGTFSLPVDSVRIDSVNGLPKGLTYGCSAKRCSFVKNSSGCTIITGTPLATNKAGAYSLKIKGKAFTSGLPIDIEFPGALAAGEYTLTLNEAGKCTVAVEELSAVTDLKVTPNPVSDLATISFDSSIHGDIAFAVSDIAGRNVYKAALFMNEGNNTIRYNVSDLSAGLYFFTIRNGDKLRAGKIVVKH
jgi:Secretion system C-terminal sorting domain